ncbi:hypothetical protein MOVI109754_20855 [Moritella viscosa]|uniref:Uncharacterized protein n=1 Tax=Moritella viscosa TaxID=80854 RepID=A0ABY1H9I9_9GAMM|nr:Putative uncharacterized protein [Moritella viscosa]SGY91228.1 Putative uncharacterized protein [Moritella viscosa]SHO25104.1 Putative uncharacterized protein [Moritella viscosa]
MIGQQLKRQTTLLETALNNGSTLQRCVVFTCAFLVMAAIMFTEKSNISSFFFSNLPIGLGLTNTFVAPLVVLGLLMLSSAAYFCIVYVTKMSAPTHQKTERSCFLSELQLSLVFGACFGLLTATLCSLIFVVAEPYLPQEFLKYHQLFGSLDIALILLSGIVLSVLYLGLFMLPLSIFLSQLSKREGNVTPVKLATRIILTSSLIASLFVALLIAIITSTLSINLILFSVTISVITSMALSLLYWFVGLEASIIGNVVYCLLVSYLANIFL